MTSIRPVARFLAAVFALNLAGGAAALDIAPFGLSSARTNALGGSHAALTDDWSTLFANPAGFASAPDELSVAELSISVYGPVFDIADAIIGFLGPGQTLDLSGVAATGGPNAGFDIGGPLAFGWVGRNLGFAFFSRTTVDASLSGTNLGATAAGEIAVVGGYAFRLMSLGANLLDAGFLGKGFLRVGISASASILSVTDLFGTDFYGGTPLVSTAGVGFDVGIRYEYAGLLAAGLVYRDGYSPASVTEYPSADAFLTKSSASTGKRSGLIVPRLDIGLMFDPRPEFIARYFSGFKLLLDYRDALAFMRILPRNPVLNLGLGVEVVILDALSLRAGIADALPCLGFGLDLTVLRVDCAMRGRELGLEPGARPTFVLDLGLLFRY